ncbi:hypothetical protein GCM10009740_31300 [Terrabacter terrae]|uniref:DUF3552 domain-containing protein n=1 Tax=Terrabacter terrae TaxID=318434 RepID=A0ABP5G1R7_9MICO
MGELLPAIVTGLLGGGFITGGVAIYRARKTAGPERDSIVVGGAETAVLSLEKSLAAETKRADRAEAALVERDRQLAAKDARIAALEKRIDTLQAALDSMRAELHQIRTAT